MICCILDDKKGFIKDGVIQSMGFKSILALDRNIPTESVKKHADNAILVLKALATNTSFFGEDFESKKSKRFRHNETALFLGSLVLRLSKISQLNHHQVSIKLHVIL